MHKGAASGPATAWECHALEIQLPFQAHSWLCCTGMDGIGDWQKRGLSLPGYSAAPPRAAGARRAPAPWHVSIDAAVLPTGPELRWVPSLIFWVCCCVSFLLACVSSFFKRGGPDSGRFRRARPAFPLSLGKSSEHRVSHRHAPAGQDIPPR